MKRLLHIQRASPQGGLPLVIGHPVARCSAGGQGSLSTSVEWSLEASSDMDIKCEGFNGLWLKEWGQMFSSIQMKFPSSKTL